MSRWLRFSRQLCRPLPSACQGIRLDKGSLSSYRHCASAALLRGHEDDGLDWASMKRACETATHSVNGITAEDLAVSVDDPDVVKKAVSIYETHGCCVVRGLNRHYVSGIQAHADAIARQSVSLLPKAQFTAGVGWTTPDGTLFVPTPPEHVDKLGRDKQIMVLGLDYHTSSALLHAALDQRCLDIVSGILGPDVELFGKGQCFYKEPAGGNPKLLHQDSAYFEFEKEGVVGTLNYAVDTSRELNNGPLYVIPGTHRKGGYGHDRPGAYHGRRSHFAYIQHVDTRSHLALDPRHWTFEEAIPIDGKAGDTVFFHVNCVHGSTPNFSNKPRATFINRYLACGDRQIIFATDTKMRAEAEAAADIGDDAAMPRQDSGFVVRGRKAYDGSDWGHVAKAHH
eukprot:gnl/TRDRNA2_/TRDRNA2_188698_c0_seq1.p1 gnl/TRDRNA2_/TRDRNA2_188698_c0~~gnl/TRDRNA2_/TRDRNA2_188698_c0_seq1.p1  ORF type:complete len:397 (+),score=45.98 gnl/TRDRNA2_/TRDRNA2_188698_c0_seq1:81-1271(+)